MWQVTQLAERRRSMSIRLYGLDQGWDDHPRAELDEIVDLTRETLGAQAAAINLLYDDVQLNVTMTGVGAIPPLPRENGICSTVMETHHTDEIIEIPDMRDWAGLRDNPFVDGSIGALRFYAAAPLVGKHGLALGTLCGWSTETYALDETQRRVLRQLGRAVVNVLDERRRALVPDAGGVLRSAH